VEPSPTEHRLSTAKVYYLTSLDTGSAAEALAYIFKLTHRATIVGERTRGMNHFGKFLPLGQNLECFLPMGRTFDPVTGADWEGVGVTPDIAVPPGDALDVALKLAES
jgi:C-terminal processing protease CtpA/Prc